MDMTGLPTALESFVLEQIPENPRCYVAQSLVPDWVRRVRPNVDWSVPVALTHIFPYLEVFLPDAEQAWTRADPKRLESNLWVETDTRDGSDVHIMAAAVTVGPSRAIVLIRNDHRFYQTQSMLQRARELRLVYASLEREMEHKDILVHAIVHDLVAPLHSILGVLSLLDERHLPEPEAGWLRLAIDAATRQRALIGEILDVFAAEAGSSRHDDGAVSDLSDVLGRVAAERSLIARSRDVRIEVDAGPSQLVVADERRLFRVLTNLLDNALRYAPPGSTVRVTAAPEGEMFSVAVDDDGPGVSPAFVPHLFEKLAAGPDRRAQSGLGLFFCRITVEKWGGGIGYERRASGGSRFWIRLRRAAPVASRERPERMSHGEAPHAR